MRRSKEEAARTREAIVSRAAELFRKNGISATSVADIMKAAALTHGGFYRHFTSKEDLAREALNQAFAETIEDVRKSFAGKNTPDERLAAYEEYYLSDRHIRAPEFGCPAAALAGEIANADKQSRDDFSTGVNAMVANLQANLPGDEQERRNAALNIFSRQLGAVILARATSGSLASEILEANRRSNPKDMISH